MSFPDLNMSDNALTNEYIVNSDIDQVFASNIPQLSTITPIIANVTLSSTQPVQADLLESLIIPLYGTIFLLSMIGNSLVLITLARNKRMRTVTNVYLLNLVSKPVIFCNNFMSPDRIRFSTFRNLICNSLIELLLRIAKASKQIIVE